MHAHGDTRLAGPGGRNDGDPDDGRHTDPGDRLHPVVDHDHHAEGETTGTATSTVIGAVRITARAKRVMRTNIEWEVTRDPTNTVEEDATRGRREAERRWPTRRWP